MNLLHYITIYPYQIRQKLQIVINASVIFCQKYKKNKKKTVYYFKLVQMNFFMSSWKWLSKVDSQ